MLPQVASSPALPSTSQSSENFSSNQGMNRMMHLEVGAVEICGQHGEGRRTARRKSRFQHCSDMSTLRWYTARRVCGDSNTVGSQQGLPRPGESSALRMYGCSPSLITSSAFNFHNLRDPIEGSIKPDDEQSGSRSAGLEIATRVESNQRHGARWVRGTRAGLDQ